MAAALDAAPARNGCFPSQYDLDFDWSALQQQAYGEPRDDRPEFLSDHRLGSAPWKQDRFAISFFAQTHTPPIDDASFQLMRDGNFTTVGLFDHLGANKPDTDKTALQQRLCEKYGLKCLLSLDNFKEAKNGTTEARHLHDKIKDRLHSIGSQLLEGKVEHANMAHAVKCNADAIHSHSKYIGKL